MQSLTSPPPAPTKRQRFTVGRLEKITMAVAGTPHRRVDLGQEPTQEIVCQKH